MTANTDPHGNVGYLTWDEWERFTRAWSVALKHLHWWRVAGYIRSGDPDEHRTRSKNPQLGLPATWLAAEEISRLMGVLNEWPELEDAVKSEDGVFFAALLIREVETAAAKWPMSDRPHKVRFLRCRSCQELALKYFPPNLRGPQSAARVEVGMHVGGKRHVRVDVLDVTVKCTSCGAVESSEMFEHDALLISLEQERGKTLDHGSGGGGVDGSVSEDDLRVVAG